MGKNIAKTTTTFYFCDGGSCRKAGSESVVRNVRAYLRNNQLWDTTHTIKTRCNGRCEDAPTCIVQNGNFWYKKLTAQKGLEIAKSHIENHTPVEEYLLYHEEWDEINSQDERKPFLLKPFELKEDQTLGLCHIMRGFSSDQYLFPLFLFLHEHAPATTVSLTNGIDFRLEQVQEIRYASEFALEFILKEQTIEFIIAPVPKTNEALQNQKVSVTEYFVLADSLQAGIRFKNKKGELVGTVTLSTIESEAWKYITAVQLQGQTPELQTETESI